MVVIERCTESRTEPETSDFIRTFKLCPRRETQFGTTMEPVRESVASPSLDPQRRYQSMLATVNILNQARKGRRRGLETLLPLAQAVSSSSSSSSFGRRQSTDNINSGSRAKTQWQTAFGKIVSHHIRTDRSTADLLDPKIYVQDVRKGKGETAVAMATAEMALRRRKIRKWRNDRKKTLYLKFRRVAWLAILVRRICRMHYIEISNTADVSFAQVSSSRDSIDVMFDVTQFKAQKQKLLSEEAKRILRTSPEKRTAQEVYYVQIAIRQLQAIAEYPVRMQKCLARVGWYEAYGPTRVIIREGHQPMAFYFIYSGSVVVTVLEPGRLTQRTVAILKRGDSFGELAILNHCNRTSTVTTREDLQLLVISAEDFMKIFMSGGIKRFTDPDHLAFIRSIEFLKGWPIQLLDLHPKQCVFNFFRRETVLVRDSKYSDWIYIVKSGSCSVMMRLSRAKAATKTSRNKTKEDARTKTVWSKHEGFHHLTPSRHEARLVKREKSFLRNKVRLLQRTRPSRSRRDLDLPLLGEPDGAPGHVDVETAETAELRRIIEASLTKDVDDEEANMKRRDGRMERRNRNVEQELENNRADCAEDKRRKDLYGPHRTFADDLNAHRVKPISGDRESSDTAPVFVCVRILVKGAAFGLTELMFNDQPSVSLVSNGAECVVLSKQFFLEHAPEHLAHQIRLSVTPYGSVDELQVNLEKELSWKHYRDATLHKTVSQLRTERAALNKLSHSH